MRDCKFKTSTLSPKKLLRASLMLLLNNNNTLFDVLIHVQCRSTKTLPPYWKTTIPNLQRLSLSDRRLKEPPVFPWNNSTLDLFHGLRGTTPTLISLFGAPLSIERNLYPRALKLDYNNIKDLSFHIFCGSLHLLFITRQGLKAVGPSCFRNLGGLEMLALSNNKLVSLPETLFHGLTSLGYISEAKIICKASSEFT